jgi:hypothetical protein
MVMSRLMSTELEALEAKRSKEAGSLMSCAAAGSASRIAKLAIFISTP